MGMAIAIPIVLLYLLNIVKRVKNEPQLREWAVYIPHPYPAKLIFIHKL